MALVRLDKLLSDMGIASRKELKEIIILRYFSGYTLTETADLLKIPQGTAATRQRKALKLLKLELGEEVSE